MPNVTTGLFRSLGIPAFKVDTPPPDAALGFAGGSPIQFNFKTMCKIGYQFIDEAGVIHTRSDGGLLMTNPKWRIRWNLQFERTSSTGSDGGTPRGRDDILLYQGEFEFLVYLKNHMRDFSLNGSSTLNFILDFDSDEDWDWVGQDKAWEVFVLSVTPTEIAATTHVVNIILATKDTMDQLPYSWTPNREIYD